MLNSEFNTTSGFAEQSRQVDQSKVVGCFGNVMRRSVRPFVAFAFSALLAMGMWNCASSSSKDASKLSPKEIQERYGNPLPTHAKFNARRIKGGSMRFDFEYLVPRDTTIPAFPILFNSAECYVTMVDKNMGLLDTVDVHLAIGSTNESSDNDSIIVTGRGTWLNARSAEFSEVTFDVVISSEKKLYHDLHVLDLSPKNPSDSSGPLLQIIPDIDEQTDSTITFGLAAKRLRGAYADYFPNSERLRLEILTMNGETIFNSSLGKNYLQEVQPVAPSRKGEIVRYSYVWNGKLNNGKTLEAGKYIARLSLPAKPEPHVGLNLPFEWKPKQP